MVRSSYQPSKAELEEDVSIDATPEEVAMAMAPKKSVQVEASTNRGLTQWIVTFVYKSLIFHLPAYLHPPLVNYMDNEFDF